MDPNAVYQTAVAQELAREFARCRSASDGPRNTRRFAVAGALLLAVVFLAADSLVRQQAVEATKARIQQADQALLAEREGMEAPDASRTLARR